MSQANNEASGMKLPPPVMEQASAGNSQGEQAPSGAEVPMQVNEQAPRAAQAGAAMPVIPMPIQPQLPVAPQGSAVPHSPTASLQASDDNDLIEKEWVNKAKQIVERTRDDPYKQSEALTVVKVDYMKKRYNKTLKLNK